MRYEFQNIKKRLSCYGCKANTSYNSNTFLRTPPPSLKYLEKILPKAQTKTQQTLKQKQKIAHHQAPCPVTHLEDGHIYLGDFFSWTSPLVNDFQNSRREGFT